MGSHTDQIWTDDLRYISRELPMMMMVHVSASMLLPIRMCLMWILPMLSMASYVTVTLVVEMPLPRQDRLDIVALLIFCAICILGAYEREHWMRKEWIAARSAKHRLAHIEGLQDIVFATCSCILRLDEVLTIISADVQKTTRMERTNLQGHSMVEFLGHRDQELFDITVQKVLEDKLPMSIGVTLTFSSTRDGEVRYPQSDFLQADLLIVPAMQAEDRQRCIIGVFEHVQDQVHERLQDRSFEFFEGRSSEVSLEYSGSCTTDKSHATEGSDKYRRPPFGGTSKDALVQTDPVQTSTRAVETMIVWNEDAFRTCGILPPMPSYSGSVNPASDRGNFAVDGQSTSSSGASSDGSTRQRKSPRRSSTLKSENKPSRNQPGETRICKSILNNANKAGFLNPRPTVYFESMATTLGPIPFSHRCMSISLMLQHWNLQRDPRFCCPYHCAVHAADRAVAWLQKNPCKPLWTPKCDWQCTRCSGVNEFKYKHCYICGLRNTARQLTAL